MLIHKQKVVFPSPELVTVKLGEQSVKVAPFLGHREQTLLARTYLREYFSENVDVTDRVYNAESALFLGILDLCTDIRVTEENVEGKEEPLFSLDDIFGNYKFVKDVRDAIKNYGEFRATLHKTTEEMRFESNSLANIIRLVSDKLIAFLSDFEINEETAKSLSALIDKANSSDVLNEITKKLKDKE